MPQNIDVILLTLEIQPPARASLKGPGHVGILEMPLGDSAPVRWQIRVQGDAVNGRTGRRGRKILWKTQRPSVTSYEVRVGERQTGEAVNLGPRAEAG